LKESILGHLVKLSGFQTQLANEVRFSNPPWKTGRFSSPPLENISLSDPPSEIVKVVHDDGHEEIEHEKAAEEDEGDEEGEGDVGAAGLVRLQQLACTKVVFRIHIALV
jgi:hypothetical protein